MTSKSSIKRGISINEYPIGSNLVETYDKFKQLEKIKDEKERMQKIKDLLANEGAKNRLFIGRTKENSSGLFLSGSDGKPKMMIYVDDKGNPKIETYNDKGEVKNYLDDKK